MAGRKEYEMLFQLNAQLGGSYSKTFKAAQQEIVSMQKEIQALSKTQADISAFQKQRGPVGRPVRPPRGPAARRGSNAEAAGNAAAAV